MSGWAGFWIALGIAAAAHEIAEAWERTTLNKIKGAKPCSECGSPFHKTEKHRWWH